MSTNLIYPKLALRTLGAPCARVSNAQSEWQGSGQLCDALGPMQVVDVEGLIVAVGSSIQYPRLDSTPSPRDERDCEKGSVRPLLAPSYVHSRAQPIQRKREFLSEVYTFSTNKRM